MKVGIVGSGLVGATAAYALVLRGVGREIVLVDKNMERARAEADDLRHAVPFAEALEVRAGDYKDLAGSHVVLICAGANQRPGETRLQLLQRNALVFKEVVPSILAHAPQKCHDDVRLAPFVVAGPLPDAQALATVLDRLVHGEPLGAGCLPATTTRPDMGCEQDTHLPELKVRVINIVNLMKLQPSSEHPHGLSDRDFDALFTKDKPIIFAFHGYPWLIHRLTYRRTNHTNLHVRGYKEEGTTTTPFDMVVLNDLDRFHLVEDVIDRLPQLGARAAYFKQAIHEKLIEHREYICKHGDDMPAISGWKWGAKEPAGTRRTSTEGDNV